MRCRHQKDLSCRRMCLHLRCLYCSWKCLATSQGPELHLDVSGQQWLCSTTDACAAIGIVYTLCLSFTWACLHHRVLCCTWFGFLYTGPYDEPVLVLTTVACICCSWTYLYTLQIPVLLLDVSTQQSPVLHLDLSTFQGPELHLDVSTLQVTL